ncbi:ferredoxin Fer [Haloarchaeobius amylolyticus]|uniref:ferredoxin Fer n=1 Tax=Haloarchaeobius amylolyticus TaxID=1198296 RepID=UPI00226F1484
MDSPFEILGVSQEADEDEVRQAYRQRAMETHPDQGGSKREFQRVKDAYEAISSGEVEAWQKENGKRGPRPRPEPEPEPAAPEEFQTEVEYLEYQVLDDYGWSLDDEDLFEKARKAGLDDSDHGYFVVTGDDSLLEAAEDADRSWPFSCRGGACANCAVAVVEGEMEVFVDHVIPPELSEKGIVLSCIGTPTTETMQVVFNVKHLPELEDLWLPPRPN